MLAKRASSFTLTLSTMKFLPLLIAFSLATSTAQEISIADFEKPTYRDWLIAGSAFGKGPSMGEATAKYQKSFHGEGLAASDQGGPKATGHLVSPVFKIERNFLNFLVGGGSNPGNLEVQLLVDDAIVRRSTPAQNSAILKPASWDVKDLKGELAQVRLLDSATGKWGHLSVDHLVMSDKKAAAIEPTSVLPLQKKDALEKPPLSKPAPQPPQRKASPPAARIPARTEIVTVNDSLLPFATRGEKLALEISLHPGRASACGVFLRSSPEQLDSGLSLTFDPAQKTVLIGGTGQEEKPIRGIEIDDKGNLSLQIILKKTVLIVFHEGVEKFKATDLELPKNHHETAAFSTGGRAEVRLRVREK